MCLCPGAEVTRIKLIVDNENNKKGEREKDKCGLFSGGVQSLMANSLCGCGQTLYFKQQCGKIMDFGKVKVHKEYFSPSCNDGK